MELAITIINFFVLVVAIGGALAAIWKAAQGRYRYSWSALDKYCQKLSNKIDAAKLEPQMIIGLGRGGAIVAGLVASQYRKDREDIVQVSAVDHLHLRTDGRPSVIITGLHNLDVHRKRVLLVNADTYTGITLDEARKALQGDKPSVLRTASIFVPKQEPPFFFRPDFFVNEFERRKLMPWRHKGYRLKPEFSFHNKGAVLVVLHGLVATGKTSVADTLAKMLSYVPIYSDWYWFKHGLQDRHKNEEINTQHNEHMINLCLSALASKNHAILDATTRNVHFRNQIRERFGSQGLKVIFVRCHCLENSSIQRIKKRTFIGIHDFGTVEEYYRVKNDYEPITADEQRRMNLIDVDTDKLECTLVFGRTSDQEITEIMNAIKVGYLQPLRSKIQGKSFP